MVSSWLVSASLALMTANAVSAQTFSTCNPIKGDKCAPNPAFGDGEHTMDFANGLGDQFTVLQGESSLSFDKTMGAAFTIQKAGDGPTLVSKKYLFFGRVDCEIQAAPGQGIVTSMVLQSDVLDEIDWEWIGTDIHRVQSNYFGKGDVTTYDRGAFHDMGGSVDTTAAFHTYSIDWSPAKIDWLIDGQVVRTVTYDEAKGGSRFPQTPMQLRLGDWVGGMPGASPGTIEWAGGLVDFSKAPFRAYYRRCSVRDAMRGSAGAKEYAYRDSSGNYSSIEIRNATTDTPLPPPLPSSSSTGGASAGPIVAAPLPNTVSHVTSAATPSPSVTNSSMPPPSTTITLSTTNGSGYAMPTNSRPSASATNTATPIFSGAGSNLGALTAKVLFTVASVAAVLLVIT